MSYEKQSQELRAACARLPFPEPCKDCHGRYQHEPTCPAILENSPTPDAPTLEEPMTLEQVKAQHVERVLRQKNWHKSAAAKALGIDRRTIYHLIERYGIKEPQ